MRELTSVDTRLVVADCFSGYLADSPYFTVYSRRVEPWRMTLGEVDAEVAIVILRSDVSEPIPYSAIRLRLESGSVSFITDYIKCPGARREQFGQDGASVLRKLAYSAVGNLMLLAAKPPDDQGGGVRPNTSFSVTPDSGLCGDKEAVSRERERANLSH